MQQKWIQSVSKHSKKGALHRQLHIDQSKKIPKTTLVAIMRTRNGDYFYGPYGREIKVTKLLKQRANFALNVRRKK